MTLSSKNDPTSRRAGSSFVYSVVVGSGLSGSEFLENSILSHLTGLSEFSQPLSALRVLEDSSVSSLDDLLSWLLISWFLSSSWVSNDLFVDLLVEVFAVFGLGGCEALLPS